MIEQSNQGSHYRSTPPIDSCRTAIEQGKPGGRSILSGGCEIPRDTPPENLRAMVVAAKEFGQYGNGSSSFHDHIRSWKHED
jgi:hypothetical protein